MLQGCTLTLGDEAAIRNPEKESGALEAKANMVWPGTGQSYRRRYGRAVAVAPSEPVKTASYVLAGGLGLGGVTFLIGAAQGNALTRIITGVVMIGAAILLGFLARVKTPQPTVVQQIDLSGDVHAEELTCKACGGKLDSDSVSVRAGAVFVDCPYCGTSYQIEEEPKW